MTQQIQWFDYIILTSLIAVPIYTILSDYNKNIIINEIINTATKDDLIFLYLRMVHNEAIRYNESINTEDDMINKVFNCSKLLNSTYKQELQLYRKYRYAYLSEDDEYMKFKDVDFYKKLQKYLRLYRELRSYIRLPDRTYQLIENDDYYTRFLMLDIAQVIWQLNYYEYQIHVEELKIEYFIQIDKSCNHNEAAKIFNLVKFD